MNTKIMKTCCDCKNFRMWLPKKSYCIFKKDCVDSLQRDMDCYVLRKGLGCINGSKT